MYQVSTWARDSGPRSGFGFVLGVKSSSGVGSRVQVGRHVLYWGRSRVLCTHFGVVRLKKFIKKCFTLYTEVVFLSLGKK